MAIFDSSMKRFTEALDRATYNLCLLSDDSVTPALLAQLERSLATTAAAAVAKGHAAEVRARLVASWDGVAPSQLAAWHEIVERLLGGPTGVAPPPAAAPTFGAPPAAPTPTVPVVGVPPAGPAPTAPSGAWWSDDLPGAASAPPTSAAGPPQFAPAPAPEPSAPPAGAQQVAPPQVGPRPQVAPPLPPAGPRGRSPVPVILAVVIGLALVVGAVLGLQLLLVRSDSPADLALDDPPLFEPEAAPAPDPTDPTDSNDDGSAETTGGGDVGIGSSFSDTCTIAWPSAPMRTSNGIQMTTTCLGVPSEYPFVAVVYEGDDLDVSPSRATMRVEGEVVDVVRSDLGFEELVVIADSVEVLP